MQQIKDAMKQSEGGGVAQKKESIVSNLKTQESKDQVDSGSALQLFLDSIPISSIPGIKNSPVLELKTGDSVRDAIHLLYGKNVCGAPISDTASSARFSDPYIGFIDFSSMVLWFLEECEKKENRNTEGGDTYDVFDMLKQHPHIAQTKIGELAKSFLWDLFFSVHLDETLFHVLLLLSKHRLQVVPVIERSNSKLIGFISQHGVLHLLLQSCGLDWFDNIADKPLSNFRSLSVEEFIHMESDDKPGSDPTIEPDVGALLSAGYLRLKNAFPPRMDSPVTNKKTQTLKEAMRNLADTKCSFIFLVDDSNMATGMLALRDMIVHFAPPSIDSSISGGGFFESALEQTGCHVQNGTLISDNN